MPSYEPLRVAIVGTGIVIVVVLFQLVFQLLDFYIPSLNVAFSLPDTNGQLLGGPVANSLLTERWRALQDFEPPTSWFVARTSLEELPISRSACWRIRTTRAGKRARG